MRRVSLTELSFLLLFTAITATSSTTTLAQQAPAAHVKLDEALKKGDELYKAGRFKDAIEAYKEALAQDPNNDQAIGYIAYSYNKLHDSEQARQWMKRRVEIPGQTPSRKAQVLTDMTLLYWDEAHMEIAARLVAGGKSLKPEEAAAAKKLLEGGLETAQQAIAIAPRSVKAFNILNLLYRATAALESDPAARTELLSKADAALRKSVEMFEASAQQQQTADLWAVPTLSAINGTDLGQAVHFGPPSKKSSPDAMKDAKEGAAVVEVIVGRDGKVRLPRVLTGHGKLGDAALGAARQWEFEPSTFEGHAVQVIETITFPLK